MPSSTSRIVFCRRRSWLARHELAAPVIPCGHIIYFISAYFWTSPNTITYTPFHATIFGCIARIYPVHAPFAGGVVKRGRPMTTGIEIGPFVFCDNSSTASVLIPFTSKTPFVRFHWISPAIFTAAPIIASLAAKRYFSIRMDFAAEISCSLRSCEA